MKRSDRPTPAAARVAIEVNGEAWTQVPDLGQSGPDDPHYAVHHDMRGSSSVEFGDGRHGRRIPLGATVKATYSRSSGRRRESVAVTLHRTDPPSTPDQPLWVVVRDRGDAISFDHYAQDPDVAGPPGAGPRRGVWYVVLGALLLGLLLFCLLGTLHWPR